MSKITRILGGISLVCFSMASQATVFFGEDLSPGVSSANSATANASFLAGLSGVGTEDFESFAVGTSGPLAVDFGIAGTATLSGSGDISTGVAGRFPTSGSKLWETNSDFTIEFSEAVSAFGFYGTDISDFAGQITLDFINGTTTSYIVDSTIGAPNGSLLFWGIIDTANAFTSVTFDNTNGSDYFGFDDMTVGIASQVVGVPEPGSLALIGLGLAGLGFTRRKKA